MSGRSNMLGMRSSGARLGWALVLGCALAGCGVVGPDYHQPEQALASQSAAGQGFAQARPDLYSAQDLPPNWWQLYREPRLDALVQQALRHNADLRVALASLQAAQAQLDEADGGRRPTLGVQGGPNYGHSSGLSLLQPGHTPANAYHYSSGLALAYPLDLFGQLQRGIEAARADSEAAQAALDLARIHVVAGTVRAYAQICASNAQLASARQSLALQQQALAVNRQLQGAGRGSSLEVSRAESQWHQLQAGLPPLLAQRQAALYQLAVWMGELPQQLPAALADCAQPPQLAQLIPVGDGAQLLRRRPDVRQAERALAAATARIGVATADFYPKITLGLSASSAGRLADLGRSDTLGWSLGPLISWSLPQTGLAQARLERAEAVARGALANFDRTVLAALRETETVLSAYAQQLDRHAALQAASRAASDSARQARQLYQGGRSPYLEVLDAERNQAAAQAALTASGAQLVQLQLDLFLALGGGWQDAAMPLAVPASGDSGAGA
jgi:NodT family efflux transporter outer membrane factor (OMF) lipoprotein